MRSLKDFPGMNQVCLLHARRYEENDDTSWRTSGTSESQCVCELSQEALVRVRAELAWALQDEAAARARAAKARGEIVRLLDSSVGV